jgi:hypothetical protein
MKSGIVCKLLVFLIIGLSVTVTVIAEDIASGSAQAVILAKTDVFKLLKSNDANTGSAIFSMNSPSALPKDKLSFSFNEVCGKVKDYSVSVLDKCSKEVMHYNYSITESCANNTVNNTYSCVNQTMSIVDYIEQVSYDCWKNIDSIPAGTNDYKINANIQMAKCVDGNLGYRIDWIPSLDIDASNNIIMNDWAWWNASYKYKMYINTSSFISNQPFQINLSYGVNINNFTLNLFLISGTGNFTLYYNNNTDYMVIANDSFSVTMLNYSSSIIKELHGVSMISSAESAAYMGMKFRTTNCPNNCSLLNATKTSTTDYTFADIRDSSFNSLQRVAFVGDLATFAINLSDNTIYYITGDKNTASAYFDYGTTSAYNVTGTNINWIASCSGSSDDPTNARAITSITLKHIYLEGQGYGNVYAFENIAYANESVGQAAIRAGIAQSKIGSSYTPYENQQIYERLLNTSQYSGTFDLFITSGNKRYAFNYDQNTSTNFPTFYNLTPVLYVWQKYNMTSWDISADVKTFIDSTYS